MGTPLTPIDARFLLFCSHVPINIDIEALREGDQIQGIGRGAIGRPILSLYRPLSGFSWEHGNNARQPLYHAVFSVPDHGNGHGNKARRWEQEGSIIGLHNQLQAMASQMRSATTSLNGWAGGVWEGRRRPGATPPTAGRSPYEPPETFTIATGWTGRGDHRSNRGRGRLPNDSVEKARDGPEAAPPATFLGENPTSGLLRLCDYRGIASQMRDKNFPSTYAGRRLAHGPSVFQQNRTAADYGEVRSQVAHHTRVQIATGPAY